MSLPLALATVCGPGPAVPPGDTFAGTLDTSIAACPPSDAPTVALGFGRDAYEADDDVAVEYGPQGGQHVWVSFRSTGLDLTDRSTVHLTGEAGGEVVISQAAHLAWTCHDDGLTEALGLQVPVPASALGEQVTLEAKVTDPRGVEARATATFRLLE